MRLVTIVLAGVCALIAALHLDDRIQNKSIAFANLVTEPSSMATYEYVAEGLGAVAWLSFVTAMILETMKGDKVGKWTMRTAAMLVLAGNVAKLQFIIHYGNCIRSFLLCRLTHTLHILLSKHYSALLHSACTCTPAVSVHSGSAAQVIRICLRRNITFFSLRTLALKP